MRSVLLSLLLAGCAAAAPRAASPRSDVDPDGADGVHAFVSVPRGFHLETIGSLPAPLPSAREARSRPQDGPRALLS